jgi:large subunit ribosomal protein L6
MSRIGRKPVTIPTGVDVTSEDRLMKLKGPKGELFFVIPEGIEWNIDKGILYFTISKTDRFTRALYGTTRAIVGNHITGVSTGFQKDLELHGQGYKAVLKDDSIDLSVGFSHIVNIPYDKSKVTVEVRQVSNKLATIKISGIDKQDVGDCADKIRRIKPPESYRAKGGQDENKGIRFKGETVRVKAGKSGK